MQLQFALVGDEFQFCAGIDGLLGERAAAWVAVPFLAPNRQTARMAFSAFRGGHTAVCQRQILKRSMRLFTDELPT